MWLAEWSIVVDLPCQPSGSSIPPSLVMVLLVADLELVVVILLSGGCLGGGGLSKGMRVLRCASRFVEGDSFVEASRRSSGSSISPLPVAHSITTVVRVLARLREKWS